MRKDPYVFVEHMLESILALEHHVRGLTQGESCQDTKTQDAVARRLEIIGEAATSLSTAFRSANKDVPWKGVIDMRNVLIHQYFGTDPKSVWNVLQKDVPTLKRALNRIIRDKRNAA